MSTQDFFARVHERYAAGVTAGRHDEQCEWRPTGFFICNCAMRKRKAAGHVDLPGPLEYSYPTCPRCYEEVDHDGDSFVCDNCNTYWDPTDQDDDGTFNDDHGNLSEDLAKHDAHHAAKTAK